MGEMAEVDITLKTTTQKKIRQILRGSNNMSTYYVTYLMNQKQNTSFIFISVFVACKCIFSVQS